jgi:hypothetical protein
MPFLRTGCGLLCGPSRTVGEIDGTLEFGMPFLKIQENCIVNTEFIVEANYHDGSPVVLPAGQLRPPPVPGNARLVITLSRGSEITIEGEQASIIWKPLEELTE